MRLIKSVLLICALSISISGFAQYYPFLNTTSWYQKMSSIGFIPSYYTYINDGDTVHNGNIYSKIKKNNDSNFLIMAREDTLSRQIYVIYPNMDSQEYLLYDFGLPIDSSYTLYGPIWNGSLTLKLDSIVTLQVLGYTRNAYYYSSPGDNRSFMFLEGIGSLYEVFYLFALTDPTYLLLGAFMDSTMLYQGPDTVGVPCLLTMDVSILNDAYCEDDCVTLSALAGNDPGWFGYEWSEGGSGDWAFVCQKATLSVKATSRSTGCSITKSIDVNYFADPVAEFTYTSSTLGSPVYFTNNSVSDRDSCFWTFDDGTESTDCNDPNHYFPAEGSFKVCLNVWNSTGCWDSVCHNVVILPAGLLDSSPDPGFTVYPNPAGSHLTIESRKPMALITIYGVDGRKWMSLEARTATRYVINCKELAAGVYFIEVKGTDGSVGISRIVLTE